MEIIDPALEEFTRSFKTGMIRPDCVTIPSSKRKRHCSISVLGIITKEKLSLVPLRCQQHFWSDFRLHTLRVSLTASWLAKFCF